MTGPFMCSPLEVLRGAETSNPLAIMILLSTMYRGLLKISDVRDGPKPDLQCWRLRHKPYASSSSKALACFKSKVSKPSVNQP
jgi:hypothetical protein